MDKAELSKKIGTQIKVQRVLRHMSQEQLALEAEMHPAYYGCIERGEKCPGVDTLYKISRALNIPLVNLLDIEESVSNPETDSLVKSFEYRVNAAFRTIPVKKMSAAVTLIEQLSDILTDTEK